MFVTLFAAWLLGAHHSPSLSEFGLFLSFASWALFVAGGLWALYIALEPFVRRQGPKAIVSWTRLVNGDFRDPIVGRDVLVGCAAAAVIEILQAVITNAPGWLGHPLPAPDHVDPRSILGLATTAAQMLSNVSISVFLGFAFLFLLFVLKKIFKSTPVAAAIFALIFGVANVLQNDSRVLAAAGVSVFLAGMLVLLIRFGLLATVVAYFVLTELGAAALTFRGTWYAAPAWMTAAVIGVLVVWGFRTSLGGQPVFGRLSPTD